MKLFAWTLAVGMTFQAAWAGDRPDGLSDDAGATRRLTFPADRRVGSLTKIEPGAPPQERRRVIYQRQDGLDARGTVTVPADKLLKMVLTVPGWRNFAWVSSLEPDDLFSLGFPYSDRQTVHALPDDRVMLRVGRLKGLRELNLFYTNVSARGLRQLASLSNLKRLTLPYGTNDEALAEVARLPGLKALFLYNHDLTNEGLAVLANVPGLEELTITDGKRMTDAGLVHLAKLPELRALTLTSRCMTDGAMVHLRGLPKLSSLRLLISNLTETGFGQLAHMPSLRVLDLSHNDITDASAAHLGKLSQLEELNLFNTLLTDDGLAHLATLSSLKELRLDGFGRSRMRLTDEGLEHIGRITSLEDLSLPSMRSGQISDRGIAYLAGLNRLRFFRASKASNSPLSDAALESISAMRALEQLHISGKAITDDGLEHLVGLKNLQRLSLFVMRDLTDLGVATLSRLESLKSLEVSRSLGQQPTVAGLSQLNSLSNLVRLRITPCQDGSGLDLSGLTALEVLNITRVKDDAPLTDRDLAGLPHLTQLRDLTIWGDFTHESAAKVAALPELRSLNIRSPRASDKTLMALSRCPKLLSLTIGGDFTDEGLMALAYFPKLLGVTITTQRPFSRRAQTRIAKLKPELFIRCHSQ